MEFRRSKKLEREFKGFLKKYRALAQDLDLLEKVLRVYPQGQGGKHWNRLYTSDDQSITIFKARLSCRSMKGESRFRVIYAHNQSADQLVFVDFIEIYFKGEQSNNDQSLIKEYLRESLEGIY